LYFFSNFLNAVRCVAVNLASDLISSPALTTSFSRRPYRSSRLTGILLSAIVACREESDRSCFFAWSVRTVVSFHSRSSVPFGNARAQRCLPRGLCKVGDNGICLHPLSQHIGQSYSPCNRIDEEGMDSPSRRWISPALLLTKRSMRWC
jgi:hypothetical protein